jgi:hypothetical protein
MEGNGLTLGENSVYYYGGPYPSGRLAWSMHIGKWVRLFTEDGVKRGMLLDIYKGHMLLRDKKEHVSIYPLSKIEWMEI